MEFDATSGGSGCLIVPRTGTVRNSCEPERKRKIFLEEKNGNSPERKRLLRIVVAQHPSCRAIAPTIPIPFAGTSPAPGRWPEFGFRPAPVCLRVHRKCCRCWYRTSDACETHKIRRPRTPHSLSFARKRSSVLKIVSDVVSSYTCDEHRKKCDYTRSILKKTQ
jgi:hypothetical protein